MLTRLQVRGRARPMQGGARRALRWLLVGTMLCALGLASAAPREPLTLLQAERAEPDGRLTAVSLPDTVEVDDGSIVERIYRLTFDADGPEAMALYLPGMLAHGRIALNGHLLFDNITEPLGAAPRSLNRLRLIELPPAYLVQGANRIEITLRARRWVSLSRVIVGPDAALRELRDRKAVAVVFAPMLVATVIACLGASVLLIYLRRRGEPMYGYFAFGSMAWGLHTAWTVLPRAPLPGIHNYIWWVAIYTFFVFMLLMFALRFAGYVAPRIERAMQLACVATPPIYYAAHAAGALAPVDVVWRFGLVAAAFGTLASVARSAWRERSLDSALLVVASFAAASFGLRDWIVFQRNDDNFPISLAPYSGLPLVMLVAWFLIDRFVRTTESLESLNRELESRVER